MKRCIFLIFMLIILFLSCPTALAIADDGQTDNKVYVYDNDGNFLIEKSGIEVGDEFLDDEFQKWEIYLIENNTAIANKVKKINMPHVKIKNSSIKMTQNKKICLYMTHNDESYTPSDGYDSIYGAGGIHDVAKNLKSQLENLGINVYIDETLHIPHNSSAYSRSKVTATNLQNKYSPNGLFDIHRDGVAKSVYLSQNESGPLSKIRIVVGKGNPNYEENYEFAKKIFSVGQALYPWLFLDIYSGKGTYNQNLQDHALLFEMGTYLIEKEYVLSSTPYLANVLNTVLFDSQNEENGDIIIDNDVINELEEDYENRNIFNENIEKNDKKQEKSGNLGLIFVIIAILGACSASPIILILRKKNRP